jgi:mannitol-1-phosphate 5-dehydrogenase
VSKKAVQFGAGNIGRGFLGQLLYESGYETTFVDVQQDLIDEVNRRGEYPVRIVGENTYDVIVRNVRAVHAADQDAVNAAVAQADIGGTAVGVPVLPKVAPGIAKGLDARFAQTNAPPIDFILAENLIGGGPFVRDLVREYVSGRTDEVLDAKVGFVEASIGRMVPEMTEATRAEDPLLICVEPYAELPVDAKGFRGRVPDVKNLLAKDNFGAYVERKLFVHNMSHAATAYLGYLRGHEYIWQAVEDPAVREKVLAALEETTEGLNKKWGVAKEELMEHGHDLLSRYANKGLGDQVSRVGKDPVRKLGPKDRLIGSAKMCHEQGVTPEYVALVAAAGMHFNPEGDPTARTVQEAHEQGGAAAVLRAVCEVDPESELGQLIQAGEQRLRKEGWLS